MPKNVGMKRPGGGPNVGPAKISASAPKAPKKMGPMPSVK